jgi:hypothetical protein
VLAGWSALGDKSAVINRAQVLANHLATFLVASMCVRDDRYKKQPATCSVDVPVVSKLHSITPTQEATAVSHR